MSNKVAAAVDARDRIEMKAQEVCLKYKGKEAQ
jgi:hypothetical protein